LLDEDEAQDMLAEADRSPDEAEHALRRLRSLRDSIYQVLVSFARDVEVPYENLISLNSYLTSALMHSRLIIEEDHISLRWSDAAVAPLDRLLWPVTRSAVALVISDAVKRIGECADDRGCGWLFYDTTRNHSRRWCSMESCGNRAKAQRHYHREQTPFQA
jgi:predicted RNA-binding Zn ribbon-like protein